MWQVLRKVLVDEALDEFRTEKASLKLALEP